MLLETEEIVARGEHRIVVKRSLIARAEVDGGVLHLAWKGGAMSLALGEKEAAKWLQEILHPKSRLDKLGVKEGQRVSLVGVTDEHLASELERAGALVAGPAAKGVDVVFVQCDTPAALSKVATAAKRIAPAGAVWVLSTRGVAGLKDTDVMAAGKKAGLVDVKVVRFSETHSANKFVIPVAKRKA